VLISTDNNNGSANGLPPNSNMDDTRERADHLKQQQQHWRLRILQMGEPLIYLFIYVLPLNKVYYIEINVSFQSYMKIK
jgi:hypothetical protein